MSNVRDPESDQPLPQPGAVAVHEHVIAELTRTLACRPGDPRCVWGWLPEDVTQEIIDGMRQRLELGVSKYGRPLESHNGRNAVQDAWEEALDVMVYLTQMELEQQDAGDLPAAAMYILRRLARARIDRRARG